MRPLIGFLGIGSVLAASGISGQTLEQNLWIMQRGPGNQNAETRLRQSAPTPARPRGFTLDIPFGSDLDPSPGSLVVVGGSELWVKRSFAGSLAGTLARCDIDTGLLLPGIQVTEEEIVGTKLGGEFESGPDGLIYFYTVVPNAPGRFIERMDPTTLAFEPTAFASFGVSGVNDMVFAPNGDLVIIGSSPFFPESVFRIDGGSGQVLEPLFPSAALPPGTDPNTIRRGAFDNDGNFYFSAEMSGYRIMKWDADSEVTTVFYDPFSLQAPPALRNEETRSVSNGPGNTILAVNELGVAMLDGDSGTVIDSYEFGEGRRAVLDSLLVPEQQDDCPADLNFDGILSPADFNAWVLAFNQGCP